MLTPVMKDGIPTCPCGCQEFSVGCAEVVYTELDASRGRDGWGEHECVENLGSDPDIGMICRGCDEDLEMTPEVVKFIRSIGG